MTHSVNKLVACWLLLLAVGTVGLATDISAVDTADASPQAVLRGITRLMDSQTIQAVEAIKSTDRQAFVKSYGEIISLSRMYANEASRAATSFGEAIARVEQVRTELTATPNPSGKHEAAQKAEAAQLTLRRLDNGVSHRSANEEKGPINAEHAWSFVRISTRYSTLSWRIRSYEASAERADSADRSTLGVLGLDTSPFGQRLFHQWSNYRESHHHCNIDVGTGCRSTCPSQHRTDSEETLTPVRFSTERCAALRLLCGQGESGPGPGQAQP